MRVKDKVGRGALSRAASKGSEAVVRILLDKGLEIDEREVTSQCTSLVWAAQEGKEAVVQLLLERGADIEAKDNQFHRTPILWAARKGHKNVTQLLTRKGANANAKDKNGDGISKLESRYRQESAKSASATASTSK
ncbi:hypothetical protein TWF718_007885 [Orbilia javanica]|uniref:Ankyrin n=1 Tax=Orbilia javanica TaxID=47235 RepID=A0AAN8N3T8_9PEZI